MARRPVTTLHYLPILDNSAIPQPKLIFSRTSIFVISALLFHDYHERERGRERKKTGPVSGSQSFFYANCSRLLQSKNTKPYET